MIAERSKNCEIKNHESSVTFKLPIEKNSPLLIKLTELKFPKINQLPRLINK